MKRAEYEHQRGRALLLYERAGIALTEWEKAHVEVADFGLGEVETTGLEIVVYYNDERYCAKEMALFPRQTCPEHVHAPLEGYIGKQETFRCRYGEVFLYVEGRRTPTISAVLPAGSEKYYTVFNEIELHPGEQYTIKPNTRHWFQAGKDGAVVSEFSTKSYDEYDIFTDPRIKRIPTIE